MLQLDGSDPSSEHFGWDIFLQEEQPNGIATEDISGKKRKSSAKQQKTSENHFDNFLSTKRVKHNIRDIFNVEPSQMAQFPYKEILSHYCSFIYKQPKIKAFNTWDKYGSNLKCSMASCILKTNHSSALTIIPNLEKAWKSLRNLYLDKYQAQADDDERALVQGAEPGHYLQTMVWTTRVLWQEKKYFEHTIHLVDIYVAGRISEVSYLIIIVPLHELDL